MADYKVPGEYVYKDKMVMHGSFPADVLERVPDFEFYPDDVLIQTYPKSGTTWLSQIIYLIVNDCDIGASRKVNLVERCKFLAMMDEVEMMKSPRIIKTHLPYEFFKGAYERAGEKGFKTIVGLRNVKDTLVSFYHFYRMSKGYGNFDQSFDVFFNMFKARRLAYGDYFDNVLSWWKERNNPNLHFVKYEDLKANPRAEIAKMASFLGKSFTEHELDQIIDESSFESMKKNPMANCENLPYFNDTISKFLRKGEVGDWKNYFTEEQSQYVDSLCERKLAPFGLEWPNL